jgi:hypothetical protein
MLLLSTVLLAQSSLALQNSNSKRNSRCARFSRSLHNRPSSNTALQLVPPPSSVIDGFSDAFIGGTVGVMSVAFLLELKKSQDTSAEACPYW